MPILDLIPNTGMLRLILCIGMGVVIFAIVSYITYVVKSR
jgi:hypothetical protein